ncbi:PREDICTED: uncharacterized protein LOC109333813 [Lupinus angustifolius]|uniref:uncharacterized protein LOC109333813 n=1 Tax=Lupinus angustifolius TaxID=3871 RepID=UPI00092F8FCF|nr:PREDICTED: uncharacterized protein LOC109333813 [Lupinus angustifolius]
MVQIEVASLFDYTMKGQWREILEAYKNNPGTLEAKITKAEDTVLHMAVYVGQTCLVKTLLDNITEDMSLTILNVQNLKGNTLLHIAAELGNVDICKDIVKRDPGLICIRNNEGETPLFLAATHGKRDAFFCLHGHLQSQDDYSLCRKSNGDTILHSTISSEYFGLALQILGLYPHLAGSVNEDGLTPLHILARKPNCFLSCTRMELYERIVYSCLFVDEVQEEANDQCNNRADTDRYPKNYRTCMNFFSLFKTALKVLTTGKDFNAATDDVENDVSQKSYLRREQAKKEKRPYRFPPNWVVVIHFLSLTVKILLIICGVGVSWLAKIQRKKERHMRAKQVMNELIERASLYMYDDVLGRNPHAYALQHGRGNESINSSSYMKKGNFKERNIESPILVAARMGVAEMVESILDKFPVAIQDADTNNKNVVLLAIENRQPHVYRLLSKMDLIKESAFRQVDNQGNSAVHLAATYRNHKPWRVPGAAMQMQWEYKWYKLVKNSMPPNFYERYNNKGQTAKQIFINTHGLLVKEGSKWLCNTAESCSVVAALVAAVAFSTSTTIPGGPNQESGIPIFQGRTAFKLFALASLVALCSSVTSLVLFLSILSSRFQEKDFVVDLPRKLLVGLTTLLTSIASVLISFCAGHYFVIEDQMKVAVYPIYAATCLPISFFAFVQLPLYLDLTSAIFRKVPQRSYKMFSP